MKNNKHSSKRNGASAHLAVAVMLLLFVTAAPAVLAAMPHNPLEHNSNMHPSMRPLPSDPGSEIRPTPYRPVMSWRLFGFPFGWYWSGGGIQWKVLH